MRTPRSAHRGATEVLHRLSLSDLLVVGVAILPVLLIGYSLSASLLDTASDTLIAFCTVLIAGAGVFVMADVLRHSRPPRHAMASVLDSSRHDIER